ncbi:hypothetical protein C8A00DRAFT_17660 [Chaetomidium leptoderma]|uniref:C2H2-type domain-containing protein n=1 Tax=Chaetomidium leptoderma TaxID=669021 RepID=A0AAN6VIM4_9PEZI|nr:hypothetical protein C8A00DRAFT_17660 [Chaetomidium leptoderma]
MISVEAEEASLEYPSLWFPSFPPFQSYTPLQYPSLQSHPPLQHPSLQHPPLQYTPLSTAEDTVLDYDPFAKRPADNEFDGDYRPNKRQKVSTEVSARRSPVKAAVKAGDVSRARPRRSRASNADPTPCIVPPSASTARNTLLFLCPTCKNANFASQADLDAHIKKQHPVRPFSCVFDFAGCGGTFASKNEWKRHVASQHLLLNYWRCPEDACAPPAGSPSSTHHTHTSQPNGAIFNRKDLFTQHLRRMHAPKETKDLFNATASPGASSTSKKATSHKPKPTRAQILAKWETHVRELQSTAMHARCALPTRMRCPIPSCTEPEFHGADAWDQRMEHVARHIEAMSSAAEEIKKVLFGGEGDETLVDWASRADVGIIERAEGGKGWVLVSPFTGWRAKVDSGVVLDFSVGQDEEDDE